MDYIEGNPKWAGLYLCYVNGLLSNRADSKILFWDGSHWSYPMSDQNYRDTVYGCYGPIPALELTE